MFHCSAFSPLKWVDLISFPLSFGFFQSHWSVWSHVTQLSKWRGLNEMVSRAVTRCTFTNLVFFCVSWPPHQLKVALCWGFFFFMDKWCLWMGELGRTESFCWVRRRCWGVFHRTHLDGLLGGRAMVADRWCDFVRGKRNKWEDEGAS